MLYLHLYVILTVLIAQTVITIVVFFYNAGE